MPKTHFYLDDYTDETMPCLPTLEAWAAWLSKPDPTWRRAEAAKDGDVFKGYALIELGDIRVDRAGEDERADTAAGWRIAQSIPPGTTSFFLRHDEGSSGWDAEYAGGTVDDALNTLEDEEGPFWLACVMDGPPLIIRYVTQYGADPVCVAKEVVEAEAK